jgi:integrase
VNSRTPKTKKNGSNEKDVVVVAVPVVEEQVLYVLLAATGMRISEALALETKHSSTAIAPSWSSNR